MEEKWVEEWHLDFGLMLGYIPRQQLVLMVTEQSTLLKVVPTLEAQELQFQCKRLRFLEFPPKTSSQRLPIRTVLAFPLAQVAVEPLLLPDGQHMKQQMM